MVQVKKYF